MHIFIDETGDTGFKLDKGSSKIFTITLIVFNDPGEIENAVHAIKRLEERLRLPQPFEWHFSKTRPTWRREFLKVIQNCNFTVRTVIMIKKNIDGKKLTTDKDSFYGYSCKLVIQYALGSLNEAKIIFDKRGPREFNTKLRQYFRNKCKFDHKKIQSIKSKDSQKEKPLQIVDMVAGAIGRYFTDKKDRNDYYDIIKDKIVDLFKFPDDLKKHKR